MYIIMKKTRAVENPTKLNAYRGPACEGACVKPGLVYISRMEAQEDADKLGKVNPVGFVVLPLKGWE
jgi:hypothetical protein